jgi:hypothetical protein
MTIDQAMERVRQFNTHTWTYEIAVNDGRGDSPFEDDRINDRSSYSRATVVVGGQDHALSVAMARSAGYYGPIVHYYD